MINLLYDYQNKTALFGEDLSLQSLLEEKEYNKNIEKLKLEILDVDKFIRINEIQEITNPVTFVRNGSPSPDGLLSNEIFGITKEDRAGTFGYINLHGVFIDPSCYKAWYTIDSRIKSIVHKTQKYRINSVGEIIEDDNGNTGVEWIKRNFDKLKFLRNKSLKRDIRIEYLKSNKDKLFINKYIVIPAYYRDINTTGRNVGIGVINKLYRNLILASKSLESTTDYGFDNTGAINGRIQETIVEIYDFYAGNSNSSLTEVGTGMSKKKGIIKKGNQSKTVDYGSRLVISAQELKVENIDDIMVDLEHAALPLAATIANFYPFMIFNIKRFFENQFNGVSKYPVYNKKSNKIELLTPKDPLIEFSDERIKKELSKFLHSHSDRFTPIQIPMEENDKVYYMRFNGRKSISDTISDQKNNINIDPLSSRMLTWCDVFYMAAVESTRDKLMLVTRYPIDRYTNQIPLKIIVSSTTETEPVYVNNTYYKYYPKIRQEDINTNTNNKFVDTFIMSNLYLDAMGADFDGDTVTTKGAYTVEANDELDKYLHSKANFIGMGATNVRIVGSKDCLQSLYCLTKILPDEKLTNPQF